MECFLLFSSIELLKMLVTWCFSFTFIIFFLFVRPLEIIFKVLSTVSFSAWFHQQWGKESVKLCWIWGERNSIYMIQTLVQMMQTKMYLLSPVKYWMIILLYKLMKSQMKNISQLYASIMLGNAPRYLKRCQLLWI